jgi:hypothetical protein
MMDLQQHQALDIDLDDEDELILALLMFSASFCILYHHRLRQKRVWKWRPAYEYTQSSFSLELMPPGKARAWLRFSVEEIIELAPLLQLHAVEYRGRIQVISPFFFFHNYITY